MSNSLWTQEYRFNVSDIGDIVMLATMVSLNVIHRKNEIEIFLQISFITESSEIFRMLEHNSMRIFSSKIEIKWFKSFKITRSGQRMPNSPARDSQNTHNLIFPIERLVFAKRLTVTLLLVLRLSIDSQKKCVFYHSGYP